MKNTKEHNIQKTLWHIKRHCKNIENNHESENSKTELLHLKFSIEILSRILNNENPTQIWIGMRYFREIYLKILSKLTLERSSINLEASSLFRGIF